MRKIGKLFEYSFSRPLYKYIFTGMFMAIFLCLGCAQRQSGGHIFVTMKSGDVKIIAGHPVFLFDQDSVYE